MYIYIYKKKETKRNKTYRISTKAQVHSDGSSLVCVSFEIRLIRTVDDADAGRVGKSAHQRCRQREIHYF